jgi:Uma2 family endonuclease
MSPTEDTTRAVAVAGRARSADQRVFMAFDWARLERFLALKGDDRVPRLAYLDGTLELMTPSVHHERYAAFIGRLLEAYASEVGIDLSPYGSWTLRKKGLRAAIEPDECYMVGDQDKSVPDLAIEVAWTRGGLDKLEIYRRLGVGEVWQWKRGVLGVFVLERGGFRASSASRLFPKLDLDLLTSFLGYDTTTRAQREYRAALRAERPKRRR